MTRQKPNTHHHSTNWDLFFPVERREFTNFQFNRIYESLKVPPGLDFDQLYSILFDSRHRVLLSSKLPSSQKDSKAVQVELELDSKKFKKSQLTSSETNFKLSNSINHSSKERKDLNVTEGENKESEGESETKDKDNDNDNDQLDVSSKDESYERTEVIANTPNWASKFKVRWLRLTRSRWKGIFLLRNIRKEPQ